MTLPFLFPDEAQFEGLDVPYGFSRGSDVAIVFSSEAEDSL